MFDWLKSKISSRNVSGKPLLKPILPLPASPKDFGDYKVNFERARLVTANCGYNARKMIWTNNEISQERLNGALDFAGIKDLRPSATQCLKWCHYMAPYFEKHLGCQVELTIGQLWAGEDIVFSPTWKDIERWTSNGIQAEDFQTRGGMNLHAWMTASNGEIIEPTLLSSLATVKESLKKIAGEIACRPETDMFGFRYFPMASGSHIVETINKVSMLNFLAKEPNDLYNMDYVMIVRE